MANKDIAASLQPPAASCSANERLILSTILAHGPLPGVEIARQTNLSAQTASVITRTLEAQGLLQRGSPVRGRVGKPWTPLTLNPDGALSLGLKIGRRTADLVLVNFLGDVLRHEVLHYPYPTPERAFAFVETALGAIKASLTSDQSERLTGLGLAVPYELWNWLDSVNAPRAEMLQWKGLDLAARLEADTGLTVCPGNDGTMACAAEHLFGGGALFSDYAYFYVGSFFGGGVVLNGVVYPGRSGNAGAFGTLPLSTAQGDQLLEAASLYQLERALMAAGFPREALWDAETTGWDRFGTVPEEWLRMTARSLASAGVAACSVLDFEAIVIDGRLPPRIKSRLVAETAAEITKLNTQGIDPPRIVTGTMGRHAGVIGAAYQPILRRYLHGGAGVV